MRTEAKIDWNLISSSYYSYHRLFGAWEAYRLKLGLRKMPIRIYVNGTRGKSSVTRLIAGELREKGILTF